MSDELYKFFLEPAKKIEPVKKVVTDRFVDAEGKPIEWEIRPLEYEEVARLRESTQKKRAVEMQGRRMSLDLPDMARFNLRFAVAATVFPDLRRKELQEAYGVIGEEALLTKLLAPVAVLDQYINTVQEISGYGGAGFEAKVEEAKNS
jgi:hypothetical protein